MDLDRLIRSLFYVLTTLLVVTVIAIILELVKWICPFLLVPMLILELVYLAYKFYKEREKNNENN